MSDIRGRKLELRREIIKRRDLILAEERHLKNNSIKKHFEGGEEYRRADTVMLFASFRSEVDTIAIIQDALKKKSRVVLPRVDNNKKELTLYAIEDMSDLKPGCMGILEPVIDEGREVLPNRLELIMVPGVAFDEWGGRIGYGTGYYDRLLIKLKERPPLIAVAYEEQIIEEVPVNDYDIRVDKIITDRRVIECRGV